MERSNNGRYGSRFGGPFEHKYHGGFAAILSALILHHSQVFPGDIEFRRIATPQATDRIYELMFTQGGRREFFWSQEPKEATEVGGSGFDTDSVYRIPTF
jgi:hypothetical protein